MSLTLIFSAVFISVFSGGQAATLGDSESCPVLDTLPGYKFREISVLAAAVVVDAVSDIDSLIEGGCDPNHNSTFITVTTTRCSSPLLERLGVDCSREVKLRGWTPLIIAVNLGSLAAVTKLVTVPGIDLDAKTGDVGPAVWDAARQGNLEIVRALKEAGADMDNVGGPNEIPPLSIAALYSREDVAGYLISEGVDVNLAGKDGATPVFYAAQNGSVAIMKMLDTAGGDLDVVGGPNKVSALALAAQEGHRDMVDFLISKAVDLDQQGLDGDTAVYLAAVYGHKQILRALHAAGASVDVPSGPGQYTPLGAAILAGNSDIAVFLVNNGANLRLKTAAGSTPAFLAAQEGDIEVLRALSEAGADLETPGGPRNLAPVAIAAANGKEKAVRFLVKQGVDLTHRDEDGQTALEVAESLGYTDIADIIRDNLL